MALALTAAMFLGACAGALPAELVRAQAAVAGEMIQPGDPVIEFQGTLESLDARTATVAGKMFAIMPETEIHGNLVLGDLVNVHASILEGGDLVAREIGRLDSVTAEPGDGSEAEFTGIVEAMAADAWTIDGVVVIITPDTEVEGKINVGDLVKVEATLGSDGALTAREIKLPASEDSDDMDEDTEFTGTVEAMAADSWTIDGKIVLITLETEVEGEIKVGDLVKVEVTLGSDGALTATEIKLPESEDSDETGEDTEFTGIVEAMAADSWTIDGVVVLITLETEVDDEIKVGDLVRVEATLGSDGSLTAEEIELDDDSVGHEDESSDGDERDDEDDDRSGEERRGDDESPSTPEPGEDD